MANSTSNLDLVISSQASKEITVNALIDAGSVSTLFGRRATTTTGLTFGFYGGALRNNGTVSQIANGTVALTANLTNYVEATGAGAVSANTTAFTAGRTPLYAIVAGASTITSYIDYRVYEVPAGWLSKSVAAGGTITLTQAESVCTLFEFSGVLPNNTTVIFPARGAKMQIDNITTGAFTLTVKTAAGLGVVVPQGKTMNLYCNNTDIEESNSAKEDKSAKGAASGYCPLDAGSKVPLANLPAAVAGAMTYIGTWNATTNTPTLASGVGTKGYYYKVATAGTTSLDGHAVWSVDDVAVFNGTAWDIIQGGITSAEMMTALGFTLSGTAAQTYTFPTTTATLARADAGQTFTGVQGMTSPDIATSITTPSASFDAFNVTATTVNAFGAATALSIGAATGTASINNAAVKLTSAGSVSAPSLYLSTDTTTGLYRIGANNLGVAVSGVKVMDISGSGLAVTTQAAGDNSTLTATTAFAQSVLATAFALSFMRI